MTNETDELVNEQVYKIALIFVEFVEQTLGQPGRQSWFWTTKDGERLTCVEHIVRALLAGELTPLLRAVELNVNGNQGARRRIE